MFAFNNVHDGVRTRAGDVVGHRIVVFFYVFAFLFDFGKAAFQAVFRLCTATYKSGFQHVKRRRRNENRHAVGIKFLYSSRTDDVEFKKYVDSAGKRSVDFAFQRPVVVGESLRVFDKLVVFDFLFKFFFRNKEIVDAVFFSVARFSRRAGDRKLKIRERVENELHNSPFSHSAETGNDD